MKVRLLGLLVAFALVLPVSAHHSTAMYDMNNPVTVTGVVKKFEWTNPHAFVYLEVKDDTGKVVEWEVEMMSLNHLRGYGWTRNTVKPGDVISATGGAAKNGDPSMISSYMKLGDGRMIKS
jgi:DNA/RNA endonuclease YhcR with UshA esterase domain